MQYQLGQFDQAAAQFEQVLRANPPAEYATPSRLKLGLALLATNKLPAARQALAEVAKTDKSNAPAAQYGLAQCDIVERKFDAADATLAALSSLKPPPVSPGQLLLERGICQARLGQHAEAVTFLKQALAAGVEGAEAEATYRLAYSLHQLKAFEESLAKTTKLLADAEKAPAAQSASPATRSLTALPLNASLRESAADLHAENLYQLGRYEEAQGAFDAMAHNAADLASRPRFVLRAGQCAFQRGLFQDVIKQLAPLLADRQEAAPADASIQSQAAFLLGDAYLQTGQFDAATAAWERYLSNPPAPSAATDRIEATYKLAVALQRGSTKPADERIGKLLQSVAEREAAAPAWAARAHYDLGRAAYSASPPRLDQAEDHLQHVVKLGAAAREILPQATHLLGWVAFDQGQYKAAADRWAQVATLLGADPPAAIKDIAVDAAFHRGVALQKAGDLQPALEAFDAVIKSYRDSAFAGRSLQASADCLMALGKPAEAADRLAKAAAAPDVSQRLLYDLLGRRRKRSSRRRPRSLTES